MSAFAPFAGNRFFCGRIHRRPLLIALLDRFGWHQEYVMVHGRYVVKKVWQRAPGPVRSIYTCRKRLDHWRAVIKPPGERTMVRIHDRDFSDFWFQQANKAGVKNRQTPFWKSRIQQRTRERDTVQVPTSSWEIGHRYVFTRWESL